MKRIFIHIGLDKTGSTAIQESLERNKKRLNEMGYGYLGRHYRYSRHIRLMIKNRSYDEIDCFRRYIRSKSDKNLILSFEGFYNLSEEQIELLLSIFLPNPITVILYVRNRPDKIRSGFAQRLKFNRAADVNFLKRVYRNGVFVRNTLGASAFDYFGVVNKWENVLKNSEDNNFLLGVYEKSSLCDGDLISDFLQKLDIDAPLRSDLSQHKNGTAIYNANPSLSPAVQLVMVHFALIGLDQIHLSRLRKFLQKIDRNPFTSYSLIRDSGIIIDPIHNKNDSFLAKRYLNRRELFLDRPKFRTINEQDLRESINCLLDSRFSLKNIAEYDFDLAKTLEEVGFVDISLNDFSKRIDRLGLNNKQSLNIADKLKCKVFYSKRLVGKLAGKFML